ncbi:MAG: cytochrome C [Sulfurimonas sp.]|nr:cytochrome C [Sulfurimonas sp.]MDQ7060553.1 cytochrome C [Sulfurimonas sp.]
MNKIAKIALAATVLLTLSTTTANASPDKGQKYFTKKLKSPCGISGAALAGRHTQEEWQKINAAGGIGAELKNICPKVKDSALKDKYIPHYFDFLFEYGSDSGNIPAC